MNEILKFDSGPVENIVGKGENAGYQHFLLFPQCFQKPSDSGSLKVGILWLSITGLKKDGKELVVLPAPEPRSGYILKLIVHGRTHPGNESFETLAPFLPTENS